jgi:soluble epoxide hydrolase/lipid-phosphate phosphatase
MPPSRDFMPLEELVKHAPNLGYQSYFASDKSNLEILAHVGILYFLQNIAA